MSAYLYSALETAAQNRDENRAAMQPTLHPWIDTPEAQSIARRAVQIPLGRMAYLANLVGRDELEAEAWVILTECAVPARVEPARSGCAQCGKTLDGLRKGAKFCGVVCKGTHGKNVSRGRKGVQNTRGGQRPDAIPNEPQGHVGSMHSWPVEDMEAYAVREVGYALMNWLRTGGKGRELAASEALANMSLAMPEPDLSARGFLVDWLEGHGMRVEGSESFDELAIAAMNIKGISITKAMETFHDTAGVAA